MVHIGIDINYTVWNSFCRCFCITGPLWGESISHLSMYVWSSGLVNSGVSVIWDTMITGIMQYIIYAVVPISAQSGLWYDSLFVTPPWKHTRCVIYFRCKFIVLVSTPSDKLTHIPDNAFITVYQDTLVCEWAPCFGPNGTFGWMGQKQLWHKYFISFVTWHYFKSYVSNATICVG